MTEEVLIETLRVGAILRVTAIHALTGTEVVFQAPANSSRLSLQRLAISKLKYVMRDKK